MNNKFYVYLHKDPINQKIMYVGYGSNHRAWVFNALVFRQEKHLNYLKELMNNNFLPGDWVYIVKRGLTKEEATKFEKELIKEYNPEFNTHKGLCSMVDKDKITKAKKLRSEKLSYTKIAEKMNLAPMTVWRYVNVG